MSDNISFSLLFKPVSKITNTVKITETVTFTNKNTIESVVGHINVLTRNANPKDNSVGNEIPRNTRTMYSRTGNATILCKIIKRAKSDIIAIKTATTIVISAGNPNFKNNHETGRFMRSNVPTAA